MPAIELYDRIGLGYAATRGADPRIAGAILDALGEAGTVVNVGAGAGGYEPADRQVVAIGSLWLTEDYFPEIVRLERGRCPSVEDVVDHIGECRVEHVAVPHDCTDGFLAAFWRRPEAYLDPDVRSGMSGFALLDGHVVDRGVARLRGDLESGAWERRHGHLMSLDSLDVCYRLVVSSGRRGEKPS